MAALILQTSASSVAKHGTFAEGTVPPTLAAPSAAYGLDCKGQDKEVASAVQNASMLKWAWALTKKGGALVPQAVVVTTARQIIVNAKPALTQL